MSYQVLARKWRPKIFADVVGQKHVLTALVNSLSLRRIHHAWLFSGTRGVGKTSIARLLAKGLNCETGITANPCGMCDSCREIEQGRFIDLIEIDAASHTKVEDTRELLDNVHYTPTRGRFKVYLIDEVHMLSRHSFNALLKTLEEPPAHVNFLLATTDSQKLPVTILSRCLQFHLKALDVEQIRRHLEYILSEEQIDYDLRALQLLASAAEGSMRDALSLTDQAIACGNGKLTAETVSSMLGTLDDDQALSLIEAIFEAKGDRVITLVNDAASRGVEWESLLIEMQILLHRIAMAQLSPDALSSADTFAIKQRIYELAHTVPPNDVQLFYQIMLIGRKELPFAPDRRMGVEMTLLRALAFHPQNPLPDQEASQLIAPTAASKRLRRRRMVTTSTPPPALNIATTKQDKKQKPENIMQLSNATSQVLAARSQLLLQCAQGATSLKNSEREPAAGGRTRQVSDDAVLERLASVVTERAQKQSAQSSPPEATALVKKKEAYYNDETAEDVGGYTPKKLKKALEHEKTLKQLAAKLAEEAIVRDAWSAEVNKLKLPKLVKQLALNAWKEQNGRHIRLHLRPGQQHHLINLLGAQKTLTEALTALHGVPVELTIIEDDNNRAVRTPFEWQQAIYEEKLAQARESIIADRHIQMMQRVFDTELDEDSILPI